MFGVVVECNENIDKVRGNSGKGSTSQLSGRSFGVKGNVSKVTKSFSLN